MPAQRGGQRIGFGLAGVEAADEAGEGGAAAVELKSVAFERIHDAAGEFEEELVDLDRCDEAIEHYRELIRLDQGDHQSVRYLLLTALLLAARDEEASTLIEQFGDEPTALWRYGRALAVFRREGDSRAARECLRTALRTNRHVPRFLTDEADWPGPEPTAYAPGSREEAVICDSDLHVMERAVAVWRGARIKSPV